MDGRLPLPTLLSHALVAFTIEFDNEFEHQVPHRTTNHGSTTHSRPVPWLVSRVMWSNFMRFVDEEGITVRELQQRLQMTAKNMRIWLTRMGEWWGYIVVEPNAMVHPTPGGRKAIEIWRTLESLIERRWRERFGKNLIDHLRESLATILSRIGIALPDGLPILGYGLFTSGPEDSRPRGDGWSNWSPRFLWLRSSPRFCCASPLSSSGNRRCRSPSVPMSCVSPLRKGSR